MKKKIRIITRGAIRRLARSCFVAGKNNLPDEEFNSFFTILYDEAIKK